MSHNSGSSSSPDPSSASPPDRHPFPLYWQHIPSIKILRPPKGRFSQNVDERCFTYCSQTVRGRLEQQEPWCRTVCIRRVFPHEVRRILSFHSGLQIPQQQNAQTTSSDQAPPLKIPLPPEGQNTPGLFDSFIGSSSHSDQSEDSEDEWGSIVGPKPRPEQRHWREGFYLWFTKSAWASQEKVDMMRMPLHQQAMWHKYKAQVKQDWDAWESWEQRMQQGAPPTVGEDRHEDFGHLAKMFGPPAPHVEGAPPPPWFPDTTVDTILLPIPPPLPPIHQHVKTLLAPAAKVCALTVESITDGSQRQFAARIWEKAATNEPFVLAKNVCQKMWKTWNATDEQDEEGKDRP